MRAKAKRVSFDLLQDWRTYFGTPPKADFDAYLVGSSFVFFAENRFGHDRLMRFFKKVGQTQDLAQAMKNAFDVSPKEFEDQWLVELDKVAVPSLPKIVKLIPQDGAMNIPEETAELIVEFDRPMAKRISVGTKCDDGICYTNAYWKTDRILAIRVDGKLRAGHKYSITLGTSSGLLQSADGLELPLTNWTFTTESKLK